MAVRFDASGEGYSSTGSPPEGTFTVFCWIYLPALPADYGTFWESSTTAGNYLQFVVTPAGVLEVWSFTGADTRILLGPAINTGRWYRTAVVRDTGAGTVVLHYAREHDALTSVSGSVGALTSPTTFRIGNSIFASQWLNGRMARVQHDSVARTQAEADSELLQYQPLRTSNLVRLHHFLLAETTDYSGNGRTLSGGTGATTEDGPPISWTQDYPQLVLPTVSGAGSTLRVPAMVSQYGGYH